MRQKGGTHCEKMPAVARWRNHQHPVYAGGEQPDPGAEPMPCRCCRRGAGGPKISLLRAGGAPGNERLAEPVELLHREIYAAGMITSDTGLCEVKHIASAGGLALGWPQACRCAPSRRSRTFRFALCRASGSNPAARTTPICCAGEEVEVFGATVTPKTTEKQLFVHFRLSQQNHLRGERQHHTGGHDLEWRTAVGCLQSHHFKKFGDADPVPTAVKMDAASVQQGFRAAEQYGLSRALFCARVRQKTARHYTATGPLPGAGCAHLRGLANVPTSFCTGVRRSWRCTGARCLQMLSCSVCR